MAEVCLAAADRSRSSIPMLSSSLDGCCGACSGSGALALRAVSSDVKERPGCSAQECLLTPSHRPHHGGNQADVLLQHNIHSWLTRKATRMHAEAA